MTELLESAGWRPAAPRSLTFRYVAGEGEGALHEALSFLVEIGPASAALGELSAPDRPAAIERTRAVIERNRQGQAVSFLAGSWIWSATAA